MPDDAVIYYEWEPPPAEIAQTLAEIADYIEHIEMPLLGARREAMQSMERRFDTESDPYGNPWAPLNPGYLEKKLNAGYPDRILVREDILRPAATSEDAWELVGHDLVFNAGHLPTKDGVSYGLVHQFGRDATHDPVTGRMAGGMPARPFIGLDLEAEARITALFEFWYEEGASRLWIRPSGHVQTRDEKGQFSSNFFPEF